MSEIKISDLITDERIEKITARLKSAPPGLLVEADIEYLLAEVAKMRKALFVILEGAINDAIREVLKCK